MPRKSRKPIKTMEPEKTSVFDSETIEVKENSYYYKVYDPSNHVEYYTSYEPKISGKKLVLRVAFMKETISDNVIDQIIESYFRENVQSEFLELDLNEGIIVSTSDENTLEWIKDTKETAIKKLQELSLEAYKKTIPMLVGEINKLNNALTSLKNQVVEEEEVPVKRRNNSGLLNLRE